MRSLCRKVLAHNQPSSMETQNWHMLDHFAHSACHVSCIEYLLYAMSETSALQHIVEESQIK